MQLFCQTGTKNLVDPILYFEQFSSPEPSSSEEEADLEQVRRQQERVIIRCDVDDEDVDINLGDGLALEVCEEKKNGDLPLKGSPSTLVTVDTRHRLWSRESDLSTNDSIKKAHLNGTGSIKERTKNSSTVIPLGPPEDSTLSENRPGDLKSKGKTKGPKA